MPNNNERFNEWDYLKTKDGKSTIYHWVVQNTKGFNLGFKTDIRLSTYINIKRVENVE